MAEPSPSTAARSPGGGGLPLGRPFGIPVFLSPSWFVIAAVITYGYAPLVRDEVGGIGASRYLVSFVFAVLLFGSVFLHELGHSLVSNALGLPVRRITIYLLGGVSEVSEPQTAARSYLVAIVGPLVSLIIAALTAALYPILDAGTVGWLLVRELAIANTLIAAFNLLPGLPLDGGQVVRAAVWQLSGNKHTGTRVAAYSGMGVAGLVLVFALYQSTATGSGAAVSYNFVILAVLAAFIFAGARQSLQVAQVQSRLPDLSLRALMRPAIPVNADVPLAEAMRQAHEADARGLVVVDGRGEPSALVNEAAVTATPAGRRPWIAVGTLARALEPDLVLSADLSGAEVLEALRRMPASEYLVVEGGQDGQRRSSGHPFLGVLASVDVVRLIETPA